MNTTTTTPASAAEPSGSNALGVPGMNARGVGESPQTLQTLQTLIDRQHRTIDYLRVSVTDRCNYRCTYCLPEEGVTHAQRTDILSFEEIARLVACFTRLGVRRVRLTGGEPTVRRDLPALVALLRRNPQVQDLALSTNGHLLAGLAAPLRRAGVDRLNISLDTLNPDRFRQITRGGDLSRVLEGIDAARDAGFRSIKLNMVAVRGFNDGELGRLCQYAWDGGAVPRFIEQMPMAEGALFVPGELMTAAQIRAAVGVAFPDTSFVPEPRAQGLGAGPARYWRATTTCAPRSAVAPAPDAMPDAAPDDGVRRYGIISAMTEHFCDTCNRVRLSAAGTLHTCLAHDDVTDLRSVLRASGEDAVVDTIRAAVAGKRDGHTFGLLGIGGPRKAMIQIGG